MKKKVKKASKRTRTAARDDTTKTDAFEEMAEEPRQGRPTTVNYEAFVRCWRGAKSVSDVAAAMGIKRNSASAIAARLREAGITLRQFPRRGAQPIDVKKLNKIAAGKDD